MTDDPQRPPAWLQMDGLEAERLRDRLEGSDDPILRSLHANLTLIVSDTEHDEAFREAAVDKYVAKLNDGDLDFQCDGLVSRGDEEAYVMAFLWVENAEAGLEPEDEEEEPSP